MIGPVMPRRGFVVLLAAAGILVSLSASVRARRPPERLLGLFRSPGSAAAVGRRYLAGHPEEASARELLTRLLENNGIRVALETGSDAQLKQVVAEHIRRDFLERRVVSVDGWMLSAVEARLCALQALW